ncbi:MAG: NAD-dependent epimerase/dehydratase family protein [Alphaproteobacteria bacterium]|nr:NAD-dependent epimerase/dehydratase family protein [Alphaproteobacteria bacterium]
MAKYVVTGGAGFIGSHVVELLREADHKVVVVDNFSTGRRENLPNDVCVLRHDLARSPSTALAAAMEGAAGVFHLAALPRIQPSFADPIGHDDANVRATVHVMQAMRATGIKRLVLSSSSAVYGTPAVLPTPETAPIDPLSPYALQKYGAERYAMLLGPRLGITVVALRYFNVFGPRSYAAESPFNAYSSVVGIFHHKSRKGERLTVTGDGEQRRDFVHVRDVARANLNAMEAYDIEDDVFNIGTGDTFSVKDVARLFSSEWDHAPERPGEARITHADTRKAASLLAWRPWIDLRHAVAAGNL